MSLIPQVIPTTDGLFNKQPFGAQVSTWGTGVTDSNWDRADQQLAGSLAIDLTDLSTYTLTDDQSLFSYLRLIGSPPGNVTLNIPNKGRQYIINNTTNHSVNVLPYAGTGAILSSASLAIFRVDMTLSNAFVVPIGTSIPSLPISTGNGGLGADNSGATGVPIFTAGTAVVGTVPVIDGGTGATTANQALTNLGGGTVGINIFKSATAAIATALLNIFTGDSGSGGIKGLVPAPAAGDAAAHKVLGAGGAWVIPGFATIGALRATTAAAVTVLSTDGVLDISAAVGTVTVTYPLSLGTTTTQQKVRINKTDTTGNQILITSDGVNPIDTISAPATTTGQINGWKDVFSNGTNLRSAGVG